MDGLALLAEAKAVGLRVSADAGRLVITGPRAAERVARKLLDHKPLVLAALQLLTLNRSAVGRCVHTLHHNDARGSWHVVPRGSRQAVVCSRCGRFFGYMPLASVVDRLRPSEN